PDELLGDVAERDGFAFDLDVRVLGFEVGDDLLDGRLGRLLGRGPVGPGDGHRGVCVAAVVVTATATARREQDGAGQAHGTSAQPPARVSARLRRSLRVRRTYHVDLSSRTAVGWRLDLWCLLGKVPQDQERSSATSSSATGTDWPLSRSQGI